MATVKSERMDKQSLHPRIVELWKQGIAPCIIRQRLGCSETTVSKALAAARKCQA